jgi:hypothetical protein
MKPYSMALHQRVLQDCDVGLTTQQVAHKYRVSTAWGTTPQAAKEAGRLYPATQATHRTPTQLGHLRRPAPPSHPPDRRS